MIGSAHEGAVIGAHEGAVVLVAAITGRTGWRRTDWWRR